MKTRFVYILFSAALFSLISIDAVAESAAFGFFINESKNESLDYLEKILPNSFASTLKNKYNFTILKPGQIPILNSDLKTGIKKETINEEDLQLITKDINADYFIYGSFKPLEGNKIKLNINIFRKGTTSVFQFEETGQLETEIFKLVDKIALLIKNVAAESMIYKNDVITPKSKFAIITNIDGLELNTLYFEFLNSGYKISPTQANELYGLIDSKQIKKFYHFGGVNASYHLIHNRKDIKLFHGTWSGVEYYKNILEEKKIYEQYAFNYQNTQNELLKKVKSFKTDAIDYIIIIGFDEEKTTAFIRCLNLNDNKLVITETGITGSSIDEITKKIIVSMTTNLKENN